jgi:hypothetical protein
MGKNGVLKWNLRLHDKDHGLVTYDREKLLTPQV